MPFEGRDLLGDVVFRRAGKCSLAAECLGGLLEAFEDRDPIRMAGDHHVHDIGFARLAGKLSFRIGRQNGPGDGGGGNQADGGGGLQRLQHFPLPEIKDNRNKIQLSEFIA